MNQLEKMAKNQITGLILTCLAEIWAPKILDIVANYHIQFQEKRMTQSQENREKACFGPKFGPPIFLFKNLASSVARYQSQLSSCKISKKTNDPILKKFTDGGMDGRTGWTDTQMDRRTRVIS